MNEEKIHHPFSPSTLQCREACPKYQPSHSETEAAIHGTIQHTVVESGQDDDRIPDFKALAAAECRAYTEERAAAYPGGWVLREIYLPIDDELLIVEKNHVEQFDITTDDGQVSPGFRNLREYQVVEGTTAGWVDFAVVSADAKQAEIIDFKFGKNTVTQAKNNLQGIAYMLGILRMFPNIEQVTVRFLMPHADYQSCHTFDLSGDGVAGSLYLRVKTVVHRALNAATNPEDFSTARASVSACLFCGLIGKCPKVAELALQIGKKFSPLSVPAEIRTSHLSDPANVAEGLKLAQVVSTWAEAYRRQATAKSIQDEFIPKGYQLVSSQKTKILSAKKVGDIAKRFLPPEDAHRVEALYEITLTPLDKIISLRTARGNKDKAVETFREALLAEGAAELGQPFAFLKLETDKENNT